MLWGIWRVNGQLAVSRAIGTVSGLFTFISLSWAILKGTPTINLT